MKTKATRKILLYGNSVILGSIGATLQLSSEFLVTKIKTPLEVYQAFETSKPELLLFDLEASEPEAPFFLLQSHPALVLIGVSPGTNLVRVWNSQQLQEMSMQDLFKLIKSRAIGVPGVHDASAIGRKTGSDQESEFSV